MNHPPSTATIHDYRNPVVRSQLLIQELQERFQSQESPNLLDSTGWFILAFASFECAISEVLSFHLIENPRLLPAEDRKIPTSKLIGTHNTHSLTKECVENYVRSLMYRPLEEMLPIACQKLTIRRIQSENLVERLKKIKEIRNEVLHEDVHHLRRSQLSLYECFRSLLEVLAHFSEQFDERFGSLSRVNAIKGIWTYMFSTQLMHPFEDFFCVDVDADSIPAIKKDARELGISNSERIYYEIWLSHFSGSHSIKGFHIRSLSGDKLFWFLTVLKRRALWGESYTDY